MSRLHPAKVRPPPELIKRLYSMGWTAAPRIQALREIAEQKITAALPCLAPVMIDSRADVRTEAARVAAGLIAENPARALQILEHGMEWAPSDARFACVPFDSITPAMVNRAEASAAPAAAFGLLCFHRNGRVREAALDRLAALQDGSEIPFLLYRATDWVTVIARRAEANLRERLALRPLRQFSLNLPILHDLRLMTRGAIADVHASIVDRIRFHEDPDYLEHVACVPTTETTSGVRRWIARLLLDTLRGEDLRQRWLRRLRSHSDPLVRVAAWKPVLESGHDPELLREALLDRWPPVRRRALELIAGPAPANHRDLLVQALFDPVDSVRATGRYYLGPVDVAAIYRENLRSPAPTLPSALTGLGQTGKPADAELVRPHLSHPKVDVRRAAVGAVARLDILAHLRELKLAVKDPSPSVSKVARTALMRVSNALDVTYLLELLDPRQPPHCRRAALWLIASLSKWRSILALLDALGAAPELENAIGDRIRHWLSKYNRSFLQPTQAEVAHLHALVEARQALLSSYLLRELRQVIAIQRM